MVGLDNARLWTLLSPILSLKLNYFIVFYRRRSPSLSSRRQKNQPHTSRRHSSRSPTPKRNKRQSKRSTSSSPLSVSPYVSAGTKETKDASDKLSKEEEEKKRYNYHLHNLSFYVFLFIWYFYRSDVLANWLVV